MHVNVSLPDEAATEALGALLAQRLTAPRTLLLSGGLGAGKTTLARAFLRALLADPALEVPSPTYTLVQTYDGPAGPVWHCDFYRLADPGEAAELLDPQALAEALVLIEWPERLGPYRPHPALDIRLELTDRGRMAVLSGLAPEEWPNEPNPPDSPEGLEARS
jgi:tRNA threonylcarbamoyladenosine biosynthesis protein TsaE